MSAQTLEAPLLGVGTVLRRERDACSMVKRPRQATNEYPRPPSYWTLLEQAFVLVSCQAINKNTINGDIVSVARARARAYCGGGLTELALANKKD